MPITAIFTITLYDCCRKYVVITMCAQRGLPKTILFTGFSHSRAQEPYIFTSYSRPRLHRTIDFTGLLRHPWRTSIVITLIFGTASHRTLTFTRFYQPGTHITPTITSGNLDQHCEALNGPLEAWSLKVSF